MLSGMKVVRNFAELAIFSCFGMGQDVLAVTPYFEHTDVTSEK
jgi:hypothetical protein